MLKTQTHNQKLYRFELRTYMASLLYKIIQTGEFIIYKSATYLTEILPIMLALTMPDVLNAYYAGIIDAGLV